MGKMSFTFIKGRSSYIAFPSDIVAGRFCKLEPRLSCGPVLWRASARPPALLHLSFLICSIGQHDCSCLLLGCHEEEDVQVGIFQASVVRHSICSLFSLPDSESVSVAFFGQQNEVEVTVCSSWEPRTQRSCAFPLALPPSCHHHERTCQASLLG